MKWRGAIAYMLASGVGCLVAHCWPLYWPIALAEGALFVVWVES